MSIRVLEPGLLTTIQDAGRTGLQAQGVSPSGAADPLAARLANLLTGNPASAAVLEMTLPGTVLEFEAACLAALSGAGMSPWLDGRAVPLDRPVWLPAGGILRMEPAGRGCRMCLAVAGGFAVPGFAGSRSTDLRLGRGGLEGRALQAGDRLECGAAAPESRRLARALAGRAGRFGWAWVDWSAPRFIWTGYRPEGELRVIPGPQSDWFDEEAWHRFYGAEYLVSGHSDRMGLRLEGPAVKAFPGRSLLSEGVATGTIQLPPDGQPIILLADRQTTGGYPKMAQLITVDLPSTAQLRPGGRVRFKPCSREEAATKLIQRETAWLELEKEIGRCIQST